MFVVVYFFRVPKQHVSGFLSVQQEAGEIYKHYGALADETFAPSDLDAKYGCGSLLSVIDLADHEQLHIGISRFENRDHHDEVMSKVDADPRIQTLYEEMLTLIDMSRTSRGEFEVAE